VFIPLAEQTGQIVKIGRWVLETACEQAASWQRAFPASPCRTMSVNVSSRQLCDSQFVRDVDRVLQDTGLVPEGLVLEITETMLMDDVDAVTRRLHELKDLGVRLAIDDFGTGYSSLAYLRRFPIDILKIDRAFVEAAASGTAGGAALVRAIVDLGTTLQLATVAEGIERPGEADHMLRLGCTSGQGFLFARPMPSEQLTHLLAEAVRTTVDR
jgi:EAL domain-containing protein (putative c-di-GMP-specific phosphodiesterase class I)